MVPEALGPSSLASLPQAPPLATSSLSPSAPHGQTLPAVSSSSFPSTHLCFLYTLNAPILILSPNFPFSLKLSPLSFPLNLSETFSLK